MNIRTFLAIGGATAAGGVGTYSLMRALGRPTGPGDSGGSSSYPMPSDPYTPPGTYLPPYSSDPYPGGYAPPYNDPYDDDDGYSYPTYPTYPSYPNTDYGYGYPSAGLWSAVQMAAPYSWSSNDVSRVANAAASSGNSAYSTAQMVREVYNATPYSWSGTQEAKVAAAALLSGRSAYETGDVIDKVESATPYSWSNNSDVRLAIAALEGGASLYEIDAVIHDATRSTSSERKAVARAESMLRLSGSYTDYPSYPIPGGSYPHHSYPDPSYSGGTSPGDTN